MSLFDRIRDAFRPALRNRAGGTAWILGIPSGVGAEDLNGRAVKTVRVLSDGMWEIDPPQGFVATRNCLFGRDQVLVLAGEAVIVRAVGDQLLEPWRDMDWTVKDESARWLPATPKQIKETEPCLTR